MATELSRTFDHDQAAVLVLVEDDYGKRSHHTLYVSGEAGVADVNAEVAKILIDIDSQTELIRARMIAAGWSPTPGA